jgi:molecular chaperone HscB
MIDFSRNHFELFALPVAYRIDTGALDTAYRKLQSEVHPDRFARGTDAEKRVALQGSARVNEAYRALKDPVARAQYVLRMHGVDAVSETDTQLPLEFLERQLARREEASEALERGDLHALAALGQAVRGEARELEDLLAGTFDDRGDLTDARLRVRELTFLAKVADDIDAMIAAQD